MLLQPCGQCGVLIKEDEPANNVTINEGGLIKHKTLCQRCFGTINEQNESAKLLQE